MRPHATSVCGLERLHVFFFLQVQHLTSDSSQQTSSVLLALHEYEHLRLGKESLDDIDGLHLAEYQRNAACLAGMLTDAGGC
jgi:hypothetical protein